MASTILSEQNRNLVYAMEDTARRLTEACQYCQSRHMHSSALAFLRHMIAQAQKRDPGDFNWKDLVLALSATRYDLGALGTIHVYRGL